MSEAVFSGYYGRLEVHFYQKRARFLRLNMVGSNPWQLEELVVLEHADGAFEPADVDAIEAWAKASSIVTLFADRWLSGKLFGKLDFLPRYNPNYTATHRERQIRPTDGMALAVRPEVADEAEALLRRHISDEFIAGRFEVGGYVIFQFQGGHWDYETSLFWNGHVLLEEIR